MLQTYKTILTNKTQLNPYTILFHFQLVEPKEMSFIPGQYMILMVPQSSSVILGRNEVTTPESASSDSDSGQARMTYIRRLYSIASSNNQKDSFELLVHIVPDGAGGKYLSGLNINDQVLFQGPAGMFTLRESEQNTVFLTTGCGISPIRSILSSISNFNPPAGGQISNLYLFWGMPYYKDVYLLDELKNFKFPAYRTGRQISNFKFTICLSREQNLDMIPENDRKYFALGRVTNNITAHSDNNNYYLCAGREVIESLKSHLEQIGVPKEQVFYEKF